MTGPPPQSTDGSAPRRASSAYPPEIGAFTYPAPLIGRKEEIADISRLLVDPEVRLVVLTGPGGVGKTRLAMELASTLADQFADGVALVHLAHLRQSALVLPAVANAVGILERAEQDLRETLLAHLAHHDLLLVLDNFEQVLDAAPLLTQILGSSHLTMLVTSRVVLDVYGEQVYPVPPMRMPGVERAPALNAVTLQSFEAVQLFVDRARAADPHFSLRDEDVPAVLLIVHQLDGLPLAIELAASRVGEFSLSELADKLDQRLSFLVGGTAATPSRMRAIRDTIAWSYDLLPDEEQVTFRQVSLFVGRWTPEDAGAVFVDLDVTHPDPSSPLDLTGGSVGTPVPFVERDDLAPHELISSLVDKSLLRRVGVADDTPHFEMLEIVREFGIERLRIDGEFRGAMVRYVRYLVDVASAAVSHLTGLDQIQWLDRLTRLHADFRIAFHWLMDQGESDMTLRLATDLWRFGYIRGHISESISWLEAALAGAPAHTALRADALNAAGVLANMLSDAARAQRLHEEALAIAQEVGHTQAVGMAFLGLGDIAADIGNYDDARWMIQSAETLLTTSGNQRPVAVAKTNLGNLLRSMGALDRAETVHAESLELYQAIGDQRGVAWSHTNIGRIAVERRNYAKAVPALQEAIGMYLELDDRSGIAEAFEALADVARNSDDQVRAATLLGAADALRVDLDYPVPGIDQAHYGQLVSALRAAGRDTFDRAWERGRALLLVDTVSLAQSIKAPATSTWAALPPAHVQTDSPHPLTPRERDVLHQLQAGKSDREISEALFIGVRTVQSHVANILSKLEVNSRTAAVARALRDGLL